MYASSTGSRALGVGKFLRRLARLSLRVLRALIIGAASFGPPRPPPEPPPPQTTEQTDERSSEA
ncbi:MAG: hypothetical protein WDO74_22580 [Pseudomonadota bacterium]